MIIIKFEPLSEIESQTYLEMQKYLKKYKDFDIQTILSHCQRVLGKKYNSLEITQAVNGLLEKRYFIQGSSLSREDILQNPVRKRILNFIQINPGAYNRLIRRDLNLGSNEFNWHTGMLEKFGLIKKIQFNARNYGYFENRSYMQHEYDLFLLQNEKIATLLKYLDTNHGTLSQIAKELEMHYSTVQKHLHVLEQRELVHVQDEGKHQYYYLNDDMILKLRKIINGQVFIDFAIPFR